MPDPAAFDAFHPFIKGVFSQWHPTPFNLTGEWFVTAEQWMMVAKARLFDDLAMAAAIMATPDPAEQKRLGAQVSGFNHDVWMQHRVSIVHDGNRAKFEQNPGALRQLSQTAPAMLVEANPRDWNWGNGLQVDDPANHSPSEWRGANLLGRILTKVREDLR
ncbi:MAG: NADAR family protein [Brevundimonas sp.]|nr:MAG: NADAR family protein [Brevundimonas sp.]